MKGIRFKLPALFGLSIFLLMQSTFVKAQNKRSYLQDVYVPKAMARLKAWPSQIIKQLAIGDTISDLRLVNLLNYPSKSVKLSDFKKKLIVLDFWGINCSACIGAIPKMEALQAKYNDDIQILLITRDDQQDVDYRKKFSPLVRNTTLPMLNHDTVFSRYFYYRTVPMHVWIDSNRVVRQITEGYNTNVENIKKYLHGEELNFAEKTAYIDFDFDKPIWMEGDGRHRNKLQYYSYIMGRIDGTSGKHPKKVLYDPVTQKPVGIYLVNQPIRMIYLWAYQDKKGKDWKDLLYIDNRELFEIDDPTRFIPPKDEALFDEWRVKNTYCYELKVPIDRSDSLFSIMRQDLERFFGVKLTIETRKVKAWVLKKMDGWPETANVPVPDTIFYADGGISVVKDGGGRLGRPSLDPAKDILVFKNWEFHKVVKWLQFKLRLLPIPLADQWENDSTIVNIVLRRGDPNNPKSNSALLEPQVLKADLEKYGLKIVEVERQMKMLVFKDI